MGADHLLAPWSKARRITGSKGLFSPGIAQIFAEEHTEQLSDESRGRFPGYHEQIDTAFAILTRPDVAESPAGEPHVMEFGLAKREAGEATMTVDDLALGTPAYMPPEQARGKAHLADRRADIYSLGVILFELLTGERPFRGSLEMLIRQVIHDEPPSPRKLDSHLPREVETICLKCAGHVARRASRSPSTHYHHPARRRRGTVNRSVTMRQTRFCMGFLGCPGKGPVGSLIARS